MRISDWSSDVCSADLRTPPPVDAPRQRRFLDALVPLSKDVLLALGRFPQVIGYDAKVGHFFPDPFGFGVEPGDVLAGSRVLDLVLVVPDANANIEFVFDDAEPAACVPADAGIAPRLARWPGDAFSVEVAGDSDRTLSRRKLAKDALDNQRLHRIDLALTTHQLALARKAAHHPVAIADHTCREALLNTAAQEIGRAHV